MQESVESQALEILNCAWSKDNDTEPIRTYFWNKCVQLSSSVLGPTGRPQPLIFWINFYRENVYEKRSNKNVLIWRLLIY